MPPMTTQLKTKQAHPHSIRLRVTDDELGWLRREAVRQERTMASLLRVMLRHYVDTKT